MTTPPTGNPPPGPYPPQPGPYAEQPGPYAPQPGPYAQQPGPYPQQPYQPAYAGAPGAYPAGPPRPGMVTGAAVLAFISAGFGIIGSFILMLGGSVVSALGASGVGGLVIVLGLISLALSALLIWGGVAAISGKSSKILVILSGISVIINLIEIIVLPAGFTAVIGMVIPVLIIVFLMNAASKAWFRAKGGQSF